MQLHCYVMWEREVGVESQMSLTFFSYAFDRVILIKTQHLIIIMTHKIYKL